MSDPIERVARAMPCPFCGSPPEWAPDCRAMKVQCSNEDCEAQTGCWRPKTDRGVEAAIAVTRTPLTTRVLVEAVRALGIVFDKLDRERGGRPVGHMHDVSGVWDNDGSNGDLAGKPCDWCAEWYAARDALSLYRKQEQPA